MSFHLLMLSVSRRMSIYVRERCISWKIDDIEKDYERFSLRKLHRQEKTQSPYEDGLERVPEFALPLCNSYFSVFQNKVKSQAMSLGRYLYAWISLCGKCRGFNKP